MNMLDLLREAQGGNGIDNLARQFGLGRDQTESVLRGVLPAVSAGFKQRTRDEGGLAGILQSIRGTDAEVAFDDPAAVSRDDVRARGDDILGQIFGSKEISRTVAQNAQTRAGVDAGTIKKMLPVITAMVMGGMQKKTSTNREMDGALGGMLQNLLGSEGKPRPSSGGGNLDDILGQVLGHQPQRRAPEPQPRRDSGGLGGILGGLLGGGRRKRAPDPAPQRRAQPQARGNESLDDLLGGMFGSPPKKRQSTGDKNFDSVIGMFDADGDGEVDMDILRQLARRR